MKNILRNLVFNLVTLTFVSVGYCQGIGTYKEHIKAISKEVKLPDVLWEENKCVQTNFDYYECVLTSKNVDSTYAIQYVVQKKSDSICYFLNELVKEYPKVDSIVLISMNAKDTLMHYIRPKYMKRGSKQIGEINFISGKYTYMYYNRLLNSAQRRFYRRNIDSLVRIEGNNVSELPEYNYDEE